MARSPIVYVLPGGTTPKNPLDVVPSAGWNAVFTDIANTFNTVQPIEYGGTNAATAAAARTNLGLAIGTDIPSVGQVSNYVARNRMVNGDKLVSQENGQTSGTTTGRYLSDQNAMFFVSSAGTFTGVNVLTISPAGGYRDRITITTADASLAAGEYLTYTQNLEGSNVRDFKWGSASANQIVIRFGFKGPAGTYAMALHNSGASRSYVALFTITAPQANTDTVQTFAVPGDVTGTWLTTDGVIGVTMDIVLAAGTTFQGVAGWQAGNILATSAVSNGMGTAAAVFEFFDAGMRLDVAATGVYGSYEVGYTDAVYQPYRYWLRRNYNTIYAAYVINSVSTSTLSFLAMAKTPAATLTQTTNSGTGSTSAFYIDNKSVTIRSVSTGVDNAAMYVGTVAIDARLS